ncbi:17.5 kDa class I heat shock protein-like protein [Drosera capensis]
MSIIPRDGPFFSDESLFDSASIDSLIDRFFSSTSSPWPTAFPFPFPSRSVPYSDLSLETEGPVATRFRSTELPEAYLFVADLPSGIGSDDVKLEINEDERAVEIGGGGGGGGRFKCRFQVPEDGRIGAVSSSVENGVVTAVVPKVGVSGGGWWEREPRRRRRNVRSIEISGSASHLSRVFRFRTKRAEIPTDIFSDALICDSTEECPKRRASLSGRLWVCTDSPTHHIRSCNMVLRNNMSCLSIGDEWSI